MKEYKKGEVLYNLYIEQEESVPVIASLFGVSGDTIVYWMKKHSIKRRTTSEAVKLSYVKGRKEMLLCKEYEELLPKLYLDEEKSTAEIGEILGIPHQTIGCWLAKFNIPARKSGASGVKNGKWKGGITSEYNLQRAKFSQSGLPFKCFERDLFTCQTCLRSVEVSGRLNAHHILSFADHKEHRFNLDNLITLCVDCHFKVHGKKRKQ